MEAEGPGGVSGRANTSDKEGGSDAAEWSEEESSVVE